MPTKSLAHLPGLVLKLNVQYVPVSAGMEIPGFHHLASFIVNVVSGVVFSLSSSSTGELSEPGTCYSSIRT